MELIIKRYSDNDLDIYETELATIQTAEKPFTPQDLLTVLQSDTEVAAEFSCNLRRVTSFLNTLDTHMGGYRVSEESGLYTVNKQACLDFRS